MSGRRAWNKRSWCCWHELANWRRSSSYAAGTRAADGIVEVIGYLQGLAETPRLGQPWPQQMETHGKTAATITPGHPPGAPTRLTTAPCRIFCLWQQRRAFGCLRADYYLWRAIELAFAYLSYYTCHQAGSRLRRKHRRSTWKDLRCYYCDAGWWAASEERPLFNLAKVVTTRHRYQGQPSCLPGRAHVPWPAEKGSTCHVQFRVTPGVPHHQVIRSPMAYSGATRRHRHRTERKE